MSEKPVFPTTASAPKQAAGEPTEEQKTAPATQVFHTPPPVPGEQPREDGFKPGFRYSCHDGSAWDLAADGTWTMASGAVRPTPVAQAEFTEEDPGGGSPQWVPTEPSKPLACMSDFSDGVPVPVLEDDKSFKSFMRGAHYAGAAFRFDDFRKEIEVFDPETQAWGELVDPMYRKMADAINGRMKKPAPPSDRTGLDRKCDFKRTVVKEIVDSLPSYAAVKSDRVYEYFQAVEDVREGDIETLDNFLVHFGADKDNPLTKHGSRTMVGSIVQRALSKGPNLVKQVITLSGPPDIGKSTTVNLLLDPSLQEFFLEGIDLSQSIQELTRQIRRFLLVECAEANGLNKAEASAIKTFVGLKSLPLRMLHNSKTENIPNRVAFISTVNPGAKMIPEDEASERRFPVVHLKHGYDGDLVGMMDKVRPALFRAAKHLLLTGQLSLNRVPPEIVSHVREAALAHKVTAPDVRDLFDNLFEAWEENRNETRPPRIFDHVGNGWLDVAEDGVTMHDLRLFAEAKGPRSLLQGQGMTKVESFIKDSLEWERRRTDKCVTRRVGGGRQETVWVHLPSVDILEKERAEFRHTHKTDPAEPPWKEEKRRRQTESARQKREERDRVRASHAANPAPADPVFPTAASAPPALPPHLQGKTPPEDA